MMHYINRPQCIFQSFTPSESYKATICPQQWKMEQRYREQHINALMYTRSQYLFWTTRAFLNLSSQYFHLRPKHNGTNLFDHMMQLSCWKKESMQAAMTHRSTTDDKHSDCLLYSTWWPHLSVIRHALVGSKWLLQLDVFVLLLWYILANIDSKHSLYLSADSLSGQQITVIKELIKRSKSPELSIIAQEKELLRMILIWKWFGTKVLNINWELYRICFNNLKKRKVSKVLPVWKP